jgi:formate hydrogenlyase subunit 3/multisubunit Na+/H+ antiporter MnhD subunit
MVSLLTGVAVTLPAMSGTLLLLWRRLRSAAAHSVMLLASAGSAISLLILLPHAGTTPVLSLDWMPGAGMMGLVLGASSVWAALVTSCALFLILLSQGSGRARFQAASGALMLFALSTANAAFLADHFLARYVALEVVALCAALILLVDSQRPTRFRPAWTSYLILRLGDAGLLSAIFVLFQASRTLHIKKTLDAAATLEGPALTYALAGFLLAVWVKLGGWPCHVWAQQGRPASLTTRAWLHGTVMPNLGLYLLYRITPLLHLSQPVQQAAIWLGAIGAAVAAVIMLTEDDVRTALIYLGAVLAGVALIAAASGVKSAIWLSVVLVTPLRALLFLTADWAERGIAPSHRLVVGGLSALAGFALLLYSLLMTWWARQASAPMAALLAAEGGIAVCVVWASRTARRLSADQRQEQAVQRDWLRLGILGLVGMTVLAALARVGPLVSHLTMSGGVSPLPVPPVSALLRHAVTIPAMWAVIFLGWAVLQLRWRLGREPITLPQIAMPVRDLENSLAQASRTLHALLEVGLLERTLTTIVRVVRDGSRIVYRVVEQDALDSSLAQLANSTMATAKGLYRVLEGEGFEELQQRATQAFMRMVRQTYSVVEQEGVEELQRRAAQAIVEGAQTTYRNVEQRSSAGILGPVVRIALGWGRTLQRWQTGRLRYNLLWVVGSLVLVVVLVLIVW